MVLSHILFVCMMVMVSPQAIAATRLAPHVRVLQNSREMLNEDDDKAGICAAELETLQAEFPNANSCTCSSNNVTDGAGAFLECQDCQYCGMGVCAQRTVTSSVSYEKTMNTQSRDEALVEKCYNFMNKDLLLMNGDTICLSEGQSDKYCFVRVGGTMCKRCEYTACGDGVSKQPLVDCSNFRQDLVFNLCDDVVTVPMQYSPFFVLDSRFDDENCTQSSAAVPHFGGSLSHGLRITTLLTAGLAYAVLVI